MTAILLVSIYFGDLPKELVDVIENKMEIRVNNQINYKLTQDQFKDDDAALKKIRNEDNKVLTFVVRAEFQLDMKCEVLFTPF